MSPSPDAAEAAPLPDDVAMLKALLLAERAAALPPPPTRARVPVPA